jgi:hypothetical protein
MDYREKRLTDSIEGREWLKTFPPVGGWKVCDRSSIYNKKEKD